MIKVLKYILPKKILDRFRDSRRISRLYYFYISVKEKVKEQLNVFYGKNDEIKDRLLFEESFIDDRFVFNTNIYNSLGWKRSSLDYRPVYSGSSDRLIFKELLKSQELRSLTSSFEVVLVSVIGGAFFLDLVSEFNFQQVTLFDSNINEHVKISGLLNFINEGNKLDAYYSLIKDDSAAFVPQLPYSNVRYKLHPESDIVYNVPGINGETKVSEKTFPIVEQKKNFPDYSMDFNQTEIKLITKKLTKNLNSNLYLTVPNFDAKGKVVVVFLSNVDKYELNNTRIYERISNASGLFILRGNKLETYRETINSNQYWRLYTYKFLNLKKVVHLVHSKKYAESYNKTREFYKTYKYDEFIDYQGGNTAFTHIILGHSYNKSKSIKKLRKVLSKLPQYIEEVLVTERNNINVESIIWDIDYITSFYTSLLTDFKMVETKLIPGGGSDSRNILIYYQRIKIKKVDDY